MSANDPWRTLAFQMAWTLIDAHLGWEVRVGVHAGPVVAGVVGQERYQFDIWGDTVNLAARMVGMGAPGSVAATQEIWEQLQSAFHGEALGEIEVKGEGKWRFSGWVRPSRNRTDLCPLLARAGHRRLGRACPLCPGNSDVHLLSDRQGVVDLDPEITYRALDLGVAEQQLH
jgi:hypothetical protein